MIFGGELRIMDENAVVEYESFKTNSRRMRAQARSLERLQREAQQAARKAGAPDAPHVFGFCAEGREFLDKVAQFARTGHERVSK